VHPCGPPAPGSAPPRRPRHEQASASGSTASRAARRHEPAPRPPPVPAAYRGPNPWPGWVLPDAEVWLPRGGVPVGAQPGRYGRWTSVTQRADFSGRPRIEPGRSPGAVTGSACRRPPEGTAATANGAQDSQKIQPAKAARGNVLRRCPSFTRTIVPHSSGLDSHRSSAGTHQSITKAQPTELAGGVNRKSWLTRPPRPGLCERSCQTSLIARRPRADFFPARARPYRPAG
jgi:hypothetical protein